MTERSSRPAALVIKGGLVYTPDGPRHTDVHVVDGVITSTESGTPAPAGAKVVEARGMYVLPGAVDAHVHSRDPGFPEKEDFGTLTAAAAAGGVTTVLDMPNTVPAVDSAGVLEAKAALARRKAKVDFGLWALVRSSSTPDQLEDLAAAGAVGFKAYLGYAFSQSRKQVGHSPEADDPDLEPPPDYGTLARLAPVIAELGLPLAVHAEDPGVLAAFRRPLDSYVDILDARPPLAEALAIAAVGTIARETGVRIHIAHLSGARGLRAAEDAIAGGAQLSLETTPSYLWLSDTDSTRLGNFMKMLPPVRTAADREALLDGLARGVIGIVATDHAPHTDAEKRQSFADAPPGSSGVQTLYVSSLEVAKRMGDVWLAPRWVSERPAALAGLGESKGAIAPGYDADLVIVDPSRSTAVRPAIMRSRQRHGALDGLEFGFAVSEVFLRGERVGTGARPRGRMVRPSGGRG
ncbi:MAG TPA: dihydroorotase family protein [Patescibacteria group bacterium]|nr:dihydroorotase family protein [Patescibacteria group bacterium]